MSSRAERGWQGAALLLLILLSAPRLLPAAMPDWPLEAPAAACAGAVPADPQAELQFLPAWRTLLAWRHWRRADTRCVQLDWPRSQRLSATQIGALDAVLAQLQAQQQAAWQPALARAYTEAAPHRPEPPAWAPIDWIAAPAPERTLPLCPRVPALGSLRTVELPPALAATVLRVRPHRCQPGSMPMAGSGVLLAPDLALTAAHVVMTRTGMVCDRYRVTPGGRRYSDPPTAPYGAGLVSRAVLSERGGWTRAAESAPPLDRDYDSRTGHDYALLLLDAPAQLPGDTLWPRLRFAATPSPIGTPLLHAGYAARTPQGRAAPGALIALYGQRTCARGLETPVRAALWMSPGASGGPIWTWSGRDALQLETLAVRVEALPGERYETLGPRFDLQDYHSVLQQLPTLPSAR